MSAAVDAETGPGIAPGYADSITSEWAYGVWADADAWTESPS